MSTDSSFTAEIVVTRWVESQGVSLKNPLRGRKFIMIWGNSSAFLPGAIANDGVNLTISLSETLRDDQLAMELQPYKRTQDNRLTFRIELSSRQFNSFYASIKEAKIAQAKTSIEFFGSYVEYIEEGGENLKSNYVFHIEEISLRVDYE